MQFVNLPLHPLNCLGQLGVARAFVMTATAVMLLQLLFDGMGFTGEFLGFVVFANGAQKLSCFAQVVHTTFGFFDANGFRSAAAFGVRCMFPVAVGMFVAGSVLLHFPELMRQLLGFLVSTGALGRDNPLFDLLERVVPRRVMVTFGMLVAVMFPTAADFAGI